jgi:RNA polymerase sigma factor (sigma-70 family)
MNEPAAPELGHLFRHESGRLVAALTRLFGLHNLALAEDVVQDALCQALDTWKIRGVPDDPSGWLVTVAKNRAIDVLRRDKRHRDFAPDISNLLRSEWTLVPTLEQAFSDEQIKDDQLRMMFACCHPELGDDARIALMLTLLCGFSAREAAAAFLTRPAAMEKRLQRAKQVLAATVELPKAATAEDVRSRQPDVLRALYLLFNEGYHGTHPERTIREELCGEALRLCEVLAAHPAGRSPATLALSALMHLHAARLPGRLDDAGELTPLADQDRSRWDRRLIERGLALLDASAEGDSISSYHYEAAIAAEHAMAPSVAETRWERVVELYDGLLRASPSPIVALNRAVALAQLGGPEAGLSELDRWATDPRLATYPFFEAARGELQHRAGRPEAAQQHFARAASLARSDLERRYLERRAQACGGAPKGA